MAKPVIGTGDGLWGFMRKHPLILGAAISLVSQFGAVPSLFAETVQLFSPDLKQPITLRTAHFSLDFRVGDDRRLYQRAIGSGEANEKPERFDEAYPQAGDGYIWEPALQAVHSDGNTSTTLLYEGITRTNEAADRELTRIKLRDPAYPFEVTLCFRTHRDKDLVEQWTEIRHHERHPVKLERMASSALG